MLDNDKDVWSGSNHFTFGLEAKQLRSLNKSHDSVSSKLFPIQHSTFELIAIQKIQNLMKNETASGPKPASFSIALPHSANG